MKSLQQFAEQHNLQLQFGMDKGDEIIPGARGEIYLQGFNDEQPFAVHISKNWNHARAVLFQLGCDVVQRGDFEGVVTFNPLNKEQSQKAIQFARCYEKGAGLPAKIPFRPIRNMPNTDKILTAAQAIKISLPLRPVKG